MIIIIIVIIVVIIIIIVFGWQYLSNATCLMRPQLLYACFVASRITILCYIKTFATLEENLR